MCQRYIGPQHLKLGARLYHDIGPFTRTAEGVEVAVDLLQQPILNCIVEVIIGVEDEAYEIDAVPRGYRTFQLVKHSVGEIHE